MRLKARWAAGTSVLAAATLAGCSASNIDASSVDLPPQVECTTYYNPTAGAENTAKEESTLRVLLGEASVENYPGITFVVTYGGDGFEGYGVRLRATDAENQQLLGVLYQLDSSGSQLATTYSGGHGFTGLHYVYSAGAELQFWCAAD